MKTIALKAEGGLENLVVLEKEMPLPGPQEVLVRWQATSLNYHDYLVAMGLIPVAEGRVPMSDGAGEVIATGAEVSQWKEGDQVMSMFFPDWQDGPASFEVIKNISGESVDGFICEASCVNQNAITRIPQGYSFAEAATLPCAAVTAWNALTGGHRLQAGQSVLIEGTGGMSIFGLQLAKALGAKVYATTSHSAKAEKLKSLGCESVVNYKEDLKWGRTVFTQSQGGVDQVLDVGGGSTMNQSIEAVTINGQITSIGILSGGRKGSITFPKLFFKFVNLRGIAVGNRVMQNELVNFIKEKNIKPIIDKSFAFDQLVDAFRYQAEGKHFGKIVVGW